MKIGSTFSSLLKTLCLCVSVVFFYAPVQGQENELSVPDDLSVLDAESTPLPIDEVPPSQNTLESTLSAPAGKFRRTIVVVLGGVNWNDWLKLTGAATPGFRKLLEESALAAVRLPGVPEYSAAFPSSPATISPAMLRAAGVLSSGQASLRLLPREAAITLGSGEAWHSGVPGWEDSPPAVAYARRTARRPQAEELLNLGWGAIEQGGATHDYGALGSAVRAVGARSLAFGSADLGRDSNRVELLREWALVAATSEGIVDGGDLSPALLAQDVTAPYSARMDAEALLSALDAALADTRTALITVEWGDTRRAAMYAPLAASRKSEENRVDVAAALKLDAITGADAWLQKLMSRLSNPNDRLLVLAVPDLQTSRAQWLPCAWWRPERAGQGALLRVRNSQLQAGLVPLESLTSLLVSRLPPPSFDARVQRLRAAAIFDESGVPSAASSRVGSLLALQSGVAWLDTARYTAQATWSVLFSLAIALSLLLLRRSAALQSTLQQSTPLLDPVADDAAAAIARELAQRRRRHSIRAARGFWVAAMALPVMFWLVGFCLEVMRRLAVSAPAGGDGGWNWTAPLALGAMGLAIIIVLGLARAWFHRTRLSRARIGLIWFALTIAGIFIGGFVLPWNSLLGPSLLDAGALPPLIGPFWALWLIAATLLGVAGLTRPPRAMMLADGGEGVRRVVNLRPAAIWMLVVGVLLLWSGWGRDVSAGLIAIAALGTMWLRLWLERALPATRASWRRGVLGAVAVIIVLLSLQRGGWVAVQSTLAMWWPAWLASWQLWWAILALAATLIAALFAATVLRPILRPYLEARYSSRIMLSAASVGGILALGLIGPAGPALLALYTLGAVFYEALGDD